MFLIKYCFFCLYKFNLTYVAAKFARIILKLFRFELFLLHFQNRIKCQVIHWGKIFDMILKSQYSRGPFINDIWGRKKNSNLRWSLKNLKGISSVVNNVDRSRLKLIVIFWKWTLDLRHHFWMAPRTILYLTLYSVKRNFWLAVYYFIILVISCEYFQRTVPYFWQKSIVPYFQVLSRILEL